MKSARNKKVNPFLISDNPPFEMLYPKKDKMSGGGATAKPIYLMTLEEYQETATPILQEYNKFIRKNEEYFAKVDYNGIFYYTFEEVMDDFKSGKTIGHHFRRGAYDKFLSDEQVVRKNWAYRKVNRFDENFVPAKTPSGLAKKKNEYIDKLRKFFSDDEIYSRIESDEVKSNKRSVKRAIDNGTYKRLLEEKEVSVEELEKVASSVGVKLPKKIFSDTAIKAQEREDLYEKIYRSLPTANKDVLMRFIKDVKQGFEPLEKLIYEQETKRFNDNIGEALAAKEIEDVALVRNFSYDTPFWYKIFHIGNERKEKISLGVDKYNREQFETHTYYSDLKLINGYKEEIHNQVIAHIESLKVYLLSAFTEHFVKLTKPMFGFEQLNLRVGKKGFEGRYKFNFEDGSSFVMNTEAIGAGGYNIQKYHFRYLVHFPTATLSDGTVLHDLGKLQILKHFATAESIELSNPYTAVRKAESVVGIIDAIYNYFVDAKPYGITHIKKGDIHPEKGGGGAFISANTRKIGKYHSALYLYSKDGLEKNKEDAIKFLKMLRIPEKSMGAGGIVLLAPNGKPSNLSEEHWRLVRTDEFKRWFKDWQKPDNINTFINSENIDLRALTPCCAIPEDKISNHKETRRHFNSFFNNYKVVNRSSGIEISISNKAVKKILNHDSEKKYHIYFNHIDSIIGESTFITSLINSDSWSRNEIPFYLYFMGGIIDLDGDKKTAYCTIEKTRKYGYKLYDLTVFKISKSELIEWNGISNPRAPINPDLLYGKDTKLSLIFDTSFEENLDENGEPKISEILRFLNENPHKLSDGGIAQKDARTLLGHLYKEHHEAFDACGEICDAATKSPEEAARIISGMWKSELEHHFKEEEEIIFPKLLSIRPELEPEANAIIREHYRFERMINELESKPSSETAKSFCLLLQNHIVKEERLFKVIMPDPYKCDKDIIYIDLDDTLVDERSGIEQGGDPSEKGFYGGLKPIAGGIEAVRKLAQHYDVYILSAPSTNSPDAWTEKVLWVKKYFGDLFEDKVILSPDKSLLEGKYLIDNSIENAGFNGEFIHFGSNEYPNWGAVIDGLIPVEVAMAKGGKINLKNTKVIDSKGNPLVVYHGSQNPNLDKFRESAYFTDNIKTAKSFADRSFMGEKLIKGEVPTLYHAHLNLENPKILTTEAEYEKYFQDITPEEHERIKSQHDGMIYYPEDEGDNYYLAFNPSQIQIIKKEILSNKMEDGGYASREILPCEMMSSDIEMDMRSFGGGGKVKKPVGEVVDDIEFYLRQKYTDQAEKILSLPHYSDIVTKKYHARDELIDWILNPANDVKVIIAFSGGKDSVAMVLKCLDMGVKKENIELWHHDVDGGGEDLFDWKCTKSYCIEFAKAFGLKILFSYKQDGIVREIYKNNEATQPIFFQEEENGEFSKFQPDPEITGTRLKFPMVGGDLQKRWCSYEVKINVMQKAINNMERFKQANMVIMTGERRQESKKRGTYFEIEPYRSYGKARRAIQWRPIIDWTEKEIWAIYERYKVQPHPCYELGWGRCSCQLCIFSSANTWASLNEISPNKVNRIREIEKDIKHNLYHEEEKAQVGTKPDGTPKYKKTGRMYDGVYEAKVSKGKSFLLPEKKKRWLKEALGTFVSPIIVEGKWELPIGAFNGEDSGAN